MNLIEFRKRLVSREPPQAQADLYLSSYTIYHGSPAGEEWLNSQLNRPSSTPIAASKRYRLKEKRLAEAAGAAGLSVLRVMDFHMAAMFLAAHLRDVLQYKRSNRWAGRGNHQTPGVTCYICRTAVRRDLFPDPFQPPEYVDTHGLRHALELMGEEPSYALQPSAPTFAYGGDGLIHRCRVAHIKAASPKGPYVTQCSRWRYHHVDLAATGQAVTCLDCMSLG